MSALYLTKIQKGFTLIEVIIFIIVSSLLMTVILLGANTSLRNAPNINNQWTALRLARQCMELYVRQRQENGYPIIVCPTSTTCPTVTGFTVDVTISCTTWNSDTSYKTIAVNVTGLARAALTTQVGDF